MEDMVIHMATVTMSAMRTTAADTVTSAVMTAAMMSDMGDMADMEDMVTTPRDTTHRLAALASSAKAWKSNPWPLQGGSGS
mmetsp:Transcript_20857/g.45861  ORF Transcript_20857/g.45861 Transcript_20857/m.45861 type:complete len:81 (+) Transcript_20857:307-549(+)